MGLLPHWGTKIQCALRQLSLWASMKPQCSQNFKQESALFRSDVRFDPWSEEIRFYRPQAAKLCGSQLKKSAHALEPRFHKRSPCTARNTVQEKQKQKTTQQSQRQPDPAQTPGFQSWQRIHFCCFQPHNSRYLITATPGN